MKIESMNKANAKAVSAQVVEKLKELEELLGVKFSYNGGKFDDSMLEMKIVANIQSKTIEGINPAEMKFAKHLKAWDSYGGFQGLRESHIGKEFTLNRGKMILVGLSSTRSNAKAIYRDVNNGSLYESKSIDLIVNALNK